MHARQRVTDTSAPRLPGSSLSASSTGSRICPCRSCRRRVYPAVHVAIVHLASSRCHCDSGEALAVAGQRSGGMGSRADGAGGCSTCAWNSAPSSAAARACGPRWLPRCLARSPESRAPWRPACAAPASRGSPADSGRAHMRRWCCAAALGAAAGSLCAAWALQEQRHCQQCAQQGGEGDKGGGNLACALPRNTEKAGAPAARTQQ